MGTWSQTLATGWRARAGSRRGHGSACFPITRGIGGGGLRAGRRERERQAGSGGGVRRFGGWAKSGRVRKTYNSLSYAPIGFSISVMGLCCKIWDQSALGSLQAARDRHRITSASSLLSKERKGWEGVWGHLWPRAVHTHRHPLGAPSGCWRSRGSSGRRRRRLWLKRPHPRWVRAPQMQAGLRGVS